MTDFDAPSEKIQFNQTTANELDNADQLANFRSKFVIEDPNLIYLDDYLYSNSKFYFAECLLSILYYY